MSSNFVMEQNKVLVFTRWTVPAPPGQQRQGPLWFVDVLEHRFDPNSNSSFKSLAGGNAVWLKVGVADGKKITLKLGQVEAKGLKTQKMWSKSLGAEPCNALTLVGENEIVAMEIVARIQRLASSIEGGEIIKRFSKEWLVPMVQ